MKKMIFLLLFLITTIYSSYAGEKINSSYYLSLRGTPKYQENFTHFDYVNPEAPKGGSITLSAIGTFDNFNRYASRGLSSAGSDELYDTLMKSSDDEIDILYPLIAKKVEYPESNEWIIFHINPKATFQDGKKITAQDVVFSFNKFMTEGVVQFKQYYSDVKEYTALDSERVKFTLKQGDKELLMSLAGLTILPEHYWKDKNFSEPSNEVPLGSSGTTIGSYKMGQHVILKRVQDYWAKDLPVNKGLNNIDQIRYDYYKDEVVTLEAFKAGEYDFRSENVAKQWATMYSGPNFDNQYIVKEEIEHDIPQGMQAFVFNMENPILKDSRVREALIYAMDFEWLNNHLFYSQYTRTRSYFQNSEYEATGLPSEMELKLLNPIKDIVPARVFTETYKPPVTDGSGNIRTQIRSALRILKSAGWEIKNKKMTHVETGKELVFELLIYSPTFERIAIPIQNNLKKMGVTMNIRRVDTSQFTNRMRERDFDLISRGYSANYYPSSNLKIIWHSKYLDSTYNTAGITDPAIDYITEKIEENQQNSEVLLYYGRVLDRVLQWNFIVIPQWHLSKFRVAYWNKFSRPDIRPKYTLGFDSWWVDNNKEKNLPNRK